MNKEREFVIDGRVVNDSSDCYVIAEIGHNHQGDVEIAKNMVRVAKECGADAVKLQKRDNKNLYTKKLYYSAYDNENSYGKTYGEHREYLEFGKQEYVELLRYSSDIGITLFSTAFDFESANFLESIDIPAFKIASGDLKNIPLIQYIARFGKPIVISTGGGELDDVRRVYKEIIDINSNICILQCTASYPCKEEELDLKVIDTFRKEFKDVVIGLSSHESGIVMPIAAYMLGARVVEKHFTLDRSMRGTDHSFSISPTGLKKMVRNLKMLKSAIGDGDKKVYDSEIKPLYKMGKKLVASRNLEVGKIIEVSDLLIKSPGDGVQPYLLNSIVGRKVTEYINEDENVTFNNTRSV